MKKRKKKGRKRKKKINKDWAHIAMFVSAFAILLLLVGLTIYDERFKPIFLSIFGLAIASIFVLAIRDQYRLFRVRYCPHCKIPLKKLGWWEIQAGAGGDTLKMRCSQCDYFEDTHVSGNAF